MLDLQRKLSIHTFFFNVTDPTLYGGRTKIFPMVNIGQREHYTRGTKVGGVTFHAIECQLYHETFVKAACGIAVFLVPLLLKKIFAQDIDGVK